MKKNPKISKNYLEFRPCRAEGLDYRCEADGKITLLIENKGFFNRVAQTVFKKPKVSQVHLDEMGSFLWPLLDGERDLLALGELVDAKFGESAHPLYERLAKYCQILESYHFITLK